MPNFRISPDTSVDVFIAGAGCWDGYAVGWCLDFDNNFSRGGRLRHLRDISPRIATGEVAVLEQMFKKDKWFEERQFSVLHRIVLNLLPTSQSLDQELSMSTSTFDLADTEGRNRLSRAVERGDVLAVKTLLLYGASLSSCSIIVPVLLPRMNGSKPARYRLLLPR